MDDNELHYTITLATAIAKMKQASINSEPVILEDEENQALIRCLRIMAGIGA